MILTTFPSRSFGRPAYRSFRSFDRAFAQLAALASTESFGPSVGSSVGPSVKGAWVDDAYQLTVDLPGVADDAVAVSVAGRTLTIDVATDSSTWNRQLRLPQTLDPEQVEARYVNGRLTVTVGKTAAPEARRVAIDTTPAQPELESPVDAESTDGAHGEATNVTG